MSNTVNYIINGVEEIVRDVLDYLIDESGKPENENQEQQKVRLRREKKFFINFDFKTILTNIGFIVSHMPQPV